MLHQSLDKKEIYLYGTLFALVHDNLVAFEKHKLGKLGIWGRARASSRNNAIDKFVRKLFSYKDSQGHSNPAAAIVTDLAAIRADSDLWADISEEQVDYVKKLVAG